MEFKLTIRLGNAAMQTPEDVSEALTRAAGYLADYYAGTEFKAGDSLSLLDQNGNRVGEWKVS